MAEKAAKKSPLQHLPTGQVRIPVCIGDLPASNYKVSSDTVTFDVVQFMRDNEDVPGVMVFKDDELLGAIPRLRMFERLGQLYGVDLFIRKPIHILLENVQTDIFSLFDYMRINEAASAALSRPPHSVYDPIIVVSENGNRKLLDTHTLLVAQSQIITSISNVMTTLERVEHSLTKRSRFLENLYFAIDMLGQNVPYHSAGIFLHRGNALELVAGGGTYSDTGKAEPDKKMFRSAIYKTMLRARHSIAIDDVLTVPDWENMADLGKMRCWLGIPLFVKNKFFGMVSVGRESRTPFRKDEVNIAEAFAGHISRALEEEYSARKEDGKHSFKVEAISPEIKGNNFTI